MLRASKMYLTAAVAAAFVSSGCMNTQKDQANNDCKKSYVGRQKSACEMGVGAAYDIAKQADGKTHDQKYTAAITRCQKLEPPLIRACTDGVKNFRAELAKIDMPKKTESSKVVAVRAKKASSRAPASAAPATTAPAATQ